MKKTPGFVAVADLARRYWPFWLVAVAVVVAAGLIGALVLQILASMNTRYERQRAAICAILANIPGRIPPEIAHGRVVFARPGHPHDCMPVHPRPQVTVILTPTPQRTVVIIRPPSPQPDVPRAQPTPSPTTSPRPTPTSTSSPTPSRSPSPTPSPRPSCVHVVVTVCT